MSEVNVQYGALEELANNINSAQSKMSGSLETAESDARSLGASWEGASQEAFNQKMLEWDNAGKELAQVLAQIEVAVQDALSRYRSGEDSITQSFT